MNYEDGTEKKPAMNWKFFQKATTSIMLNGKAN